MLIYTEFIEVYLQSVDLHKIRNPHHIYFMKKKAIKKTKKTVKKAKKPAKKTVKKTAKKAVKKTAKTAKRTVRKTVKKTAKKIAKKAARTATKKAVKKGIQKIDNEVLIGKIIHYYDHIGVGIVEITKESLKAGQKIHIKGTTTDFEQEANSMQVEHEQVGEARKGEVIGLKTKEKVREGDLVYRV